ncbi:MULTISPECIES: hypothetical protein [unclassified Bartonella]|uniref:hypothetical protein n=1 Tax=unclassified Bartonella TaxID=2645622 RepID=UPI0023617496|nr:MULTISPECIES: hypothetical protein [unclassified Bartonella]
MFKFVLCLLFLFPFASYAQEIKEITNKASLTSPLVANYPLTEDFLLKLEKIGKECKNLSSESEISDAKNDIITHDDNIEGYIAYISHKTKLMSLLKENNLTAKEFVVGLLALQATLNVLTDEEISLHKQNILPSSNIEFAKKHMYRIIKILKSSC